MQRLGQVRQWLAAYTVWLWYLGKAGARLDPDDYGASLTSFG